MRKEDHDYSDPGDYFVTLCTRSREALLGEITEDRIFPSAFGVIFTHVGAPLAGARPVVLPNRVVFGDFLKSRIHH